VAYWLERSPAKHGRLGLIFSWVTPKSLKMVSAASLAFGLCVSEKYIDLNLAL